MRKRSLLFRTLDQLSFQEVNFRWQLIDIDPDENKFVDVVLAANVDFLVSEDHHLNVLKTIEFPKLPIIGIKSFLDMVKQLL